MEKILTEVFGIWYLIGAAFVFFMQAGFAMVEAGFTRAKNAGNIIMKNLMDFCLGTVAFLIIGYSLLMGQDFAGLVGWGESPLTDFAGTNGCYLYQGRDVQERKNKHLKDQILVLAPSEGLVSSDTWLRCRKKLMANKTFQGGRKAKNTWLAGKVKCGRCGYALMSVGNPTGVQYLRCSKRADSKSCDGCGTLRTREFERFLYGEMVKKLSEFQTLTAKRETVNPKLTALNMELARVEDEIEKLLNTLTGANAVLLSYANSKIEELDTHRQALTKEIAALSAEIMSPERIERLSVYLNQWEEIDFEDRRQVADGLISQIRATDEHVSIEWKI